MMKRPYFTLISRTYVDRSWAIEFGDYERQCVAEEMRERRYSDQMRGDGKIEYKIIRTATDDQAAIDAAVAELNAPRTCIGCENPPLPGYRVCQACGEEGYQ